MKSNEDIKIYLLVIIKTIEYEFEELNNKLFLSFEERNKFKESYLKKHKNEDGKFISGITSIDFEEELLDIEELKEVATIQDIEELIGQSIDITTYFNN